MESFLDFINSHWLIISFMAPMAWAMVNIIDVYFVGGIYQDELDGTIISGLFQILPWPFIIAFTNFDIKNLVNIETTALPMVFLSLLSGILFSASFYFYFKALFQKNDVSVLQIFWNLTVIVVPILSFVFFKETLPLVSYIGMAVVLLGATLLSFDGKLREHFSKKYFFIMLGAVVFLSAAMIVQEYSYDGLFNLYNQHGFWLGFFFFSLGSFATGLAFAVFNKRNPLGLIKKFYKIFIVGEGIYFLGNSASQKALDITPSASFVAVVETFVPVFVLAYSLIILLFFRLMKKKNEIVTQIYSEQTGGLWLKVLATIIMAVGVYMMN